MFGAIIRDAVLAYLAVGVFAFLLAFAIIRKPPPQGKRVLLISGCILLWPYLLVCLICDLRKGVFRRDR